MMRVVLDSNAVDPIIDRAGALDTVREAVADGRLALYVTHVQHTEAERTPDPRRRRLLQEVLALADQRPAGVPEIGPYGGRGEH